MFSNHKEIKLEISNKESRKALNIQKLNNTFLNNPRVKEEIAREIRKYFKLNNNRNTTDQILEDIAKSVLEEKFTKQDVLFLLKARK